MKYVTVFVLAMAAFAFSPVFAEEAGISYSMKKQGRVPFQNETQDQDMAAAQDNADMMTNPADIEPAAGGYDMDDADDKASLSDNMRLPRKN